MAHGMAASLEGAEVSQSETIPINGECKFDGKRYTLRTITDLYSIPASTLEHCLKDVYGAIVSHKAIAELSGVPCLPLSEIEWFDDGKHDLACRLEARELQ